MSARDTVTTDIEYDGSAQRHIDIEYVDAITGMTEGTHYESLVDDLPTSMDFEVMAFGG